jgi:hypothetical protein
MGTITLLLLTGAVAAALIVLALREPGFYRRAAVVPGRPREQHSRDFYAALIAFRENLKEGRGYAHFTQEQINSFLEEDFIRSGLNKQVLPESISAPRVALDAERIRLAFRYHIGRWNTVISVELRVWLAAEAPNVVALELQGMRAGSLPISAQSLRERLNEAADRNDIKVEWFRHKGNPVAVVHFQSDQPRTTVLLDRLDLHPGQISISGQSVEPGTAVTPPSQPAEPSAAVTSPTALFRPSAR